MKTRRIIPVVLVFTLLAGFLLLHQPQGHQALAAEPVPDKVSQEGNTPRDRGPHTCPIVPIEVYGGGSLYEAQYFADNNCNNPTLTYIFGIFTYPRTCPDCAPVYACGDDPNNRGRLAGRTKIECSFVGPQPFYGLPAPVPADYDHAMPAGKPITYTKVAVTPDQIRYLYLRQSRVYVKVFARHVNRVDMDSGAAADDANFKETIYFAFECSNPATVGEDLGPIKTIEPANQKAIPDPCGAATTVYDVTYRYEGSGKTEHILTVLVGNPEPPEPEIVRVPTPATPPQLESEPAGEIRPKPASPSGEN